MDPKYERLNSLNEDEFRTEVLMPLLKRMGYEQVRIRHGSKEYGKDLTCFQTTKLGTVHYAVVAKVGNISGAASARDSILVSTIKDQIVQAFTIPIQDVTYSHSEVFVNQVIVWTTGRISSNAQERIIRDIKLEYRNNVVFIDGEKTIEHLETYYPAFFTIGDASISTYYTNAKRLYSRLEELYAIGGINAQKQLPVIFVAPTLKHIPRVRSRQAKQENLPNKRYPFSKVLARPVNTFILGDMGSGKSTLLRRMLISIIEENEQKLQKYPIPVFVRLKQLDLTSENPILDAISAEYSWLSEEDLHDIEQELTDGKFVVLLDGLDELETKANIEWAIQQIKEFVQNYKNSRIVITSRKLDALRASDFLSNFIIFEIEDFSYQQMKDLITNWFEGDEENGKQLVKLISSPMTLSSIPLTPLTLALVAVLYQSGLDELPANLTELFDKYTELALGRWDMSKDLASQIDWKKKQLVLRKLSWKMVNDRVTETSDDRLSEEIRALADERGLTIDAGLIHREIVERSGLLIKNLDGELEFRHRAFMDYFAGGELTAKSNAVDLIVEHFPSYWWSRVIFFACGLKPEEEGEEYIGAILNRVEKAECNSLHYAMQLGMLTQAVYLAHQELKIEAVRTVLHCFIKAWDDLVTELKEAYEKKEIPKPIPHFFLLYLFSSFVQVSIGSTTLSGALSHVTKECVSSVTPTTSYSDAERKENEWITFALAIACAGAGNVDDFVALVNTKIVQDPWLLQVFAAEAEYQLKDNLVDETTKAEVRILLKALEKQLKKSAKYLEKTANQSPKLLSDKSSQE